MRKTNKTIITLLVIIISSMILTSCGSGFKENDDPDYKPKCFVLRGNDSCIVQQMYYNSIADIEKEYKLFCRDLKTSELKRIYVGKYDYTIINVGDTIVPY